MNIISTVGIFEGGDTMITHHYCNFSIGGTLMRRFYAEERILEVDPVINHFMNKATVGGTFMGRFHNFGGVPHHTYKSLDHEYVTVEGHPLIAHLSSCAVHWT